MPASGVADPAQLGGVAVTFQQNGCNFEVYLFNGVVECESITKIDSSLFSDQERDKVVQMESASGSWAKPVTTHGQTIWMRSDGAAIFCYLSGSPLILVMSKSYIELASETKRKSSGFPSEAEVKKYVVPGMNEEDVIKKFGVPGIRMPLGSDGEVLDYVPPPSRKEMTFGYGGFEVIVKNGKVTDLEIVHETVRILK
jgi:hypothetical protein